MGPSLTDLALFAAGFVSWAISTLAAGGGSVLIVAAVAVILRGQAIAPVVTMTSVLASPARMILLWRWIDWRVVRWYLPGATAGRAARRLGVQPDRHAMAADRAGTVPDQHRVAVPDGRAAALIRRCGCRGSCRSPSSQA